MAPLKRELDGALAVLLLTALIGPMILIALAMKLTSPGPILCWSKRVGRANRLFDMPKYRTMRTGDPVVATHLLADADSRYLT